MNVTSNCHILYPIDEKMLVSIMFHSFILAKLDIESRFVVFYIMLSETLNPIE